jgi:dipeptide/tripeptide permease
VYCELSHTWLHSRLASLIRNIRIFFVVFYVCLDQMQNNLISLAKQIETNIPSDMMPAINQVACIILGPIIQYGLYPFLRRRNIRFNPIARITAGFAAIALAMLYATIVQHKIYTVRSYSMIKGRAQPNRLRLMSGFRLQSMSSSPSPRYSPSSPHSNMRTATHPN